ncbi:MAG: VTT domain-containing protein [Gammaproteobacteria bacterium]
MPIADQIDRLLARATSRAVLPFVAVALVLVIAIVVLGREVGHHLAAIEWWIADSGPWGRLAFVGLLILGTSVLLPESLFGIAAGALFGLTGGIVILTVGNLLAAAVQYALARWLLRGRIDRALVSRPQFAAIQRAVRRDEIRLQSLLRLTPLNPTTMSYVFGGAGVGFPGFLLACLAMLPHLFIETYLGHAGKHFARISGSSSHSFALHDAVTIGGTRPQRRGGNRCVPDRAHGRGPCCCGHSLERRESSRAMKYCGVRKAQVPEDGGVQPKCARATHPPRSCRGRIR